MSQDETQMMTFEVAARRIDANGSLVNAKRAELVIDTGMAGRPDALNPVELLLAALSACIIKGIERVAGTLGMSYQSVHVALTAHRPVDEARIADISYVITVGTESDQAKLELLHKNLMKFGTIYNTIKPGTNLSGSIVATTLGSTAGDA
jgi:uncharacterized OsmC-like protein